jgi:uncharacterized membrane protein
MTVLHTVHISAPRSTVWATTIDVERWPEWSPTVQSVSLVGEGPFGMGSVAVVKQPGQAAARWTVTEFAPDERFVWESRGRWLQFVAVHELTSDASGTESRLRLDVSGALAAWIWPLLRPALHRALATENSGLKTRCEDPLPQARHR